MRQRWLSVMEQEEEPHDFKGGKHDPQNEKVEEHAQKIPTQGTKLIANNIGEYREPFGSIELMVEHIYEEIQQGQHNHCLKFQFLKMSVIVKDYSLGFRIKKTQIEL